MVVHSPVAARILVVHNLVEGILAVGHTPVANNLDTLLVVAAHTPAVLYSVAGIAVFRLAVDSFAAARNLAADNFVAAADFSFGFVRAAAVLLPVVRNTCKTALRPATAGNNSYST